MRCALMPRRASARRPRSTATSGLATGLGGRETAVGLIASALLRFLAAGVAKPSIIDLSITHSPPSMAIGSVRFRADLKTPVASRPSASAMASSPWMSTPPSSRSGRKDGTVDARQPSSGSLGNAAGTNSGLRSAWDIASARRSTLVGLKPACAASASCRARTASSPSPLFRWRSGTPLIGDVFSRLATASPYKAT